MTRPLLLGALLTLSAGPAAGQVPDSLPPDAAPLPIDSVRMPASVAPLGAAPDTDRDLPISPRAAFIRSVVLPGWGQAPFEAYFRGSIYFAGWAGNWFMNFRNMYRLEDARERFDVRTEQVREGLVAAAPNPDSVRAQIDSFPDILTTAVREDSLGNDLRKLVRAREQQREDWIAWSLFWLVASGVDAYVTAQLSDFPAEVILRPGNERGVSIGLEVPLPRRRPADARPP